MTSRKAIAILLLLGFSAYVVLDEGDPEKLAAWALRIDELPASVDQLECSSLSTTDMIVECTGAIAPEDVALLASGWPLAPKAMSPRTVPYPVACGDVPGRPFQVDACFELEPAEFEHGGHVRLYLNENQNRFYLNYYEE